MCLIGRPRIHRLLARVILVVITLSLTGVAAQVHLLGHNSKQDTDHCWVCIGLLTLLQVVIAGLTVSALFVYLQSQSVATDYIPYNQLSLYRLGPRSPPSR